MSKVVAIGNQREIGRCCSRACFRVQKARSGQRDENEQSEKCLRQAGVKNSDLILQHRYAQAAEDPL